MALPLCYLLCRMELGRRKLRAALILIPAVVALAPPLFYALGLSLLAPFYTLCAQALYLSIAAALVYAALRPGAGTGDSGYFFWGWERLSRRWPRPAWFPRGLAAQVVVVLEQAVRGLPTLPLYWCGVALFVLCAGMSVGDAIHQMAESRVQADMLTLQVSALQGRLEAAHSADEAIRIERHDLRHKLQAVAAMVKKGRKR